MIDYQQAYLNEQAAREKAEQLLADKSQILVAVNTELEQKIRALKRQQTMLIQTEKMATLGTLCAGVAHEINNPLAYCTSNTGSLKEYSQFFERLLSLCFAHISNTIDPHQFTLQLQRLNEEHGFSYLIEDIPALINDTEEGLNRISQIVANLLDFSRPKEREKQFADMTEGVKSALKLLTSQLRDCHLHTHFSDISDSWCNLSVISQVMVNILINAKHACEAAVSRKSEITVRVYQHDNNIYLEVSDNGCGMSDEVQSQMYDPFFTTKAVGHGTGMGMTLVYAMVKDHHGELVIESIDGQFTKVQCILPILSQVNAKP